MPCLLRKTALLFVGTLLLSLLFLTHRARGEVDAAVDARILAALPARPTVAPARPRKLLVFTLCRGFAHESIPTASRALELMGQNTGAFDVVVSDDPAIFSPERLVQFDAVCLNNTTGTLFDDAALKQSLLDFVRNGKGLVGIHAATDCFYGWPAFGDLMGAYFDGHPWGANETVFVKLDDPAHPLCAAFEGLTFRITDEIYQFREPYSREKLRVLLSLDVTRTDMAKESIKRDDRDFAVSWLHRYGKGRVFYCSLGHNVAIFGHPKILQHYLDGIQFALGDLPADTTPSARLSAEYLEESRLQHLSRVVSGWSERVARYAWGDDPSTLEGIAHFVVKSYGRPKERDIVLRSLRSVLELDEATPAGKLFVCRQLYLAGSDEAVSSLAKLLVDENTVDVARYAFERMPGDVVDKAMRSALPDTHGNAKAAIILSLGERRDSRAIAEIARALEELDSDPSVPEAAIAALGKIGTGEALEVLESARASVSQQYATLLDRAQLVCAERLLADGETERAEAVYASLYAGGVLPAIRAAALKGLATVRGSASVPLLMEALTGEDRVVRATAADAVRHVDGTEATVAFSQALPSLEPDVQVLLIRALADRGDRAALTVVAQTAGGDDATVRLVALEALALLGDASTVPLLACAAAGTDNDEARIALSSLNRLKGADVDGAILHMVSATEGKLKTVLIEGLSSRFAYGAVPELLRQLQDRDPSIREATFTALGTLASEKALDTLVNLLMQEQDAEVQRAAESAIVSTASRTRSRAAAAESLLAAYSATSGNARARCSLVRVMGQVGHESTLAVLNEATADADPAVRDAAIRALAVWPTPAPIEKLYAIAERPPNERLGAVALEAYVRLLGLPSERSAAETVRLYEKGLSLASTPQQKRLALIGLSEVPHSRAVDIIKRYENDRDVAEDVARAFEKIKNRAFLTGTAWQISGFTLEFEEGGILKLNGKREGTWSVSENTLTVSSSLGPVVLEIRKGGVFLGTAELKRLR